MRAHPGSPAIGRWIRRDKRLAIYLRDDFTCLYCGLDLTCNTSQASLDHVVSRKLLRTASKECRQRRNQPSNLITCCVRCNSRRGSMSVLSFMGTLSSDPRLVQFRIDRLNERRMRPLSWCLRRARAIITCFGWGPP